MVHCLLSPPPGAPVCSLGLGYSCQMEAVSGFLAVSPRERECVCVFYFKFLLLFKNLI